MKRFAPPFVPLPGTPAGILGPMGKLAERYQDADRSGVYAVRDSRIPRAAAAEADAILLEVAAAALPAEWGRIEQALAGGRSGACCVLLVPGAGELAQPGHRATLERLGRMASARRSIGQPLFVVMVDPEERLGLPRLYHEAHA